MNKTQADLQMRNGDKAQSLKDWVDGKERWQPVQGKPRYITEEELRKLGHASTKGKMLDKPCKDCEGSVWNAACKSNGCVGSPSAVANLAELFSGTNKTCNKSHRSYKPSLMEASANNTVANLQRELSVLFNLATIEGSNAKHRPARRAPRHKG